MVELKVSQPGTVKAIKDGDEYKLRVLGAPFGSPEDLDKDGEYFSKRTDFALETGDTRPVMYMHGLAPNGKKMTNPDVLGRAVASEPDDQGLWFDTTLDVTKPLGKRLWDKAEQGLVRASTGAVAHLFRKAGDGEILKWVIGELSLLDVGLGRHPANDKAVAVALKSVYQEADMEYPEAFSQAEKADPNAVVAPAPDAAPQDAPKVDGDKLAAAVVAWYDAQEAMYMLAMGDHDEEMPAEAPAEASTELAA